MPTLYPPAIDHTDFIDPIVAPPRGQMVLSLARDKTPPSDSSQTKNKVAVTYAELLELSLASTTTGRATTASLTGAHATIAPTDKTQRIRIAPGVEKVDVKWKLGGGVTVSEARLELYRRNQATPFWTKTIKWEGKCPNEGSTPFDAWLGDEKDGYYMKATGAKSVAVTKAFDPKDFPDECLTAEFAPYKLKMVLVSAGSPMRSVQRFIYVDVVVSKVTLKWGGEAMLPAGRSDAGMSGERAAAIVADEKKILQALATTDATGPAAGKSFEVLIPGNLFYTDQKEWGDDSQFRQLGALWGDGPRIPIVAELELEKSDGSSVSSPEGVGAFPLLWDVEDPDPDKNRADVDDPHIAGLLDHVKNATDAPRGSTNCHATYGGKRASTSSAVVARSDGNGSFPFVVGGCDERPWAGISRARAVQGPDPNKGKSGILFQPSRIAGDTYKLTVYLGPQATGTVARLTPTEIGTAGVTAMATTGKFEVWRQVDVARLYVKTGQQDDVDFGPIKAVFEKARVRIVSCAKTVMDATKLNDAYKKAYDAIAGHTINGPKLPYLCDRDADQSGTPWAINMRSWKDTTDKIIFEALQNKGLAEAERKLKEGLRTPAWKYVASTLTAEADRAKFKAYLNDLGSKTAFVPDLFTATGVVNAIKTYSTQTQRNYAKIILNELAPKFLVEDGATADQVSGIVIFFFDTKIELFYDFEGSGPTLARNLGVTHMFRPTQRLRVKLGKGGDNIFYHLSCAKGATALDATWADAVAALALSALAEAVEKKQDVKWKVRAEEDGHYTAVKNAIEGAVRTLALVDGTHTENERIIELKAVPGTTTLDAEPYLEEELRFGVMSASLGDTNRQALEDFLRRAVDGALQAPVRIKVCCRDSDKGRTRRTVVKQALQTAFDAAKARVKVEREAAPRQYALHDVIAHEMGHDLFLPHAPGENGNQPWRHTARYNCLMNYDPANAQFCALCNVALRGWDIGTSEKAAAAQPGDVKPTARADRGFVVLGGATQRRVPISFRCIATAGFAGKGVITWDNANVVLHYGPVGDQSFAANGTDNVWENEDVLAGFTLWAEAAALGTTTFKLDLQDGMPLASVGNATVKIDVVAASFDLSRDAGSAAMVAATRQTSPGCEILVQNESRSHPRAKLVVKRTPAGDKKALTLRTLDGAPTLKVYGTEKGTQNDLLATGAHKIELAPTDTEKTFWIEANDVSFRAGDIQLGLYVEGVPEPADFAIITARAILEMKADVPVTPPRTIRPLAGTWENMEWKAYKTPLADNRPERASFHANGDDVDFAKNRPLVVVAGTASGGAAANVGEAALAAPVLLEVPGAHPPLVWEVVRAADDAGGIAAEGANPLPTLRAAPSGATNQRELLTDAVGSFHVRCFYDDGSGAYNGSQPAVVLNVVIVKADLSANNTTVTSNYCGCSVLGEDVGMHTQESTKQSFDYADNVPLRLEGVVNLIGGGPDGKRGVDRVDLGWVNNLVGDDAGALYDEGGGMKGGALAVYLIGDANAPPNITRTGPTLTNPLLDKAPFKQAAGKQICLSTSRVQDGAGRPLGKQVIVQAIDAPCTFWDKVHPRHKTWKISQVWQKTQFRANLCVWSFDENQRGAGSQLYGVLLEIPWVVEGRYYVDGSGPKGTPPKRLTVTTGTVVTHRPTVAVATRDIETSAPTGLALQVPRAFDGADVDSKTKLGDPWKA